jgi:Domain of unknown function (DUF4136)
MTLADGRFIRAAGVVGVLVFASVAGAQKLEIESHRDPDADFKAIRTYAWLPPPPLVHNVAPDAVRNPTLSQEALGPHIVAAVDRQLAARGLTTADRETADVHVAYFAALTTNITRTYLGEHYGYVTGWGSPIPEGLAPSTSTTVYEKGTVIIDIVDRAAKRAIWRGSVVTRVNQEHTLEKRIARINEGAERLFQRFPIRPKK